MSRADNAGSVVFGNVIGLDATGEAALGNRFAGIALLNGATGNAVGGAWGGNVIAANTSVGVLVGASWSGPAAGNWIQNNVIGTNLSQTAAIGSQQTGVWLAAGSTANAVDDNVIAGHGLHGIALVEGSTSNAMRGNAIGRSASGLSIPNGGFGLPFLDSGYNWATGNLWGTNVLGNVYQSGGPGNIF